MAPWLLRSLAALVLLVAWPTVGWSQESVQAAQTLYASASYDEALALLERLQQQQRTPSEVRAINEQREAEARPAAAAMLRLAGVLGLFWKKPAAEAWSPEVLRLAEAREAARKAKDWAKSDEIREQLAGHGVVVEDGAGGAKLKRKG